MARSSTVATQSESMLMGPFVPVLAPTGDRVKSPSYAVRRWIDTQVDVTPVRPN